MVKAIKVIAAAGMVAGLISMPVTASAAPAGPSRLVAPTDGLQVEVKAKRKGVVKSTRGMRKIPKKKGL